MNMLTTSQPSANNRSSMRSSELQNQRVLRLKELMVLTGYRRASIYAKNCPRSRQFDPTFPKRLSLSPTRRGAVGWLESEVLAWIQQRVDARCKSVEPKPESQVVQALSLSLNQGARQC